MAESLLSEQGYFNQNIEMQVHLITQVIQS